MLIRVFHCIQLSELLFKLHYLETKMSSEHAVPNISAIKNKQRRTEAFKALKKEKNKVDISHNIISDVLAINTEKNRNK